MQNFIHSAVSTIYAYIYPLAISSVIILCLTNFKPTYKDSKYIEKLKNDKIIMKNQLSVKQYCNKMGMLQDLNHFKYKDPPVVPVGFTCNHDFSLDVNSVIDNKTFLQYCYYINLSKNDDIHKILSSDMLNMYNKPYDKLSVVTSIILSEYKVEKKLEIIFILLSYGIKLTDHGRLLSNLEIYEQIPMSVKYKILLFLRSDILTDIKWSIINRLII